MKHSGAIQLAEVLSNLISIGSVLLVKHLSAEEAVGKIMEHEMTEDLAKAITDTKAIKSLPIHLFHNGRRPCHLKKDRTFNGFQRVW